ncbi:hypothetical protein ACFYTF_18535 [Nocardia thailandica]|uniref:Uncharacterized protein n=1 Tax=Nocardia thailandica TaxID=257275 RepID=A0ABW6PR53_9NOCA
MSEVTVRVLTGSGDLLTERLSRDLAWHLRAAGVGVEFGAPQPVGVGHKGGPVDSLMLVIALAGSAGVGRMVSTCVAEWCARDRARRVEMRIGDRSLLLDGANSDQLAILALFAGSGSDDTAQESNDRGTPAEPEARPAPNSHTDGEVHA